MFTHRPENDLSVTIRIATQPNDAAYTGPFLASVGVLDANGWSQPNLPVSTTGVLRFNAYRGVAMKLAYTHNGAVVSTHQFHTPETGDTVNGFVVLSKPVVLREAPPANLFADPPFAIVRPGVWEQDGHLHFALHVLNTSRARLKGEWMATPIELSLTNDGTFFWTRVPIADIVATGVDYHGQAYNYILNDDWLIHDPAAQWVEGSTPGKRSLLFNPNRHLWRSNSWKRPGWEYLIIYQLHPARFPTGTPS